MKPLIPRAFREEWTPSQALAVYDFCRHFSEELWECYQHELIEAMIERDRAHGIDHCEWEAEQMNLELPWEDVKDEIPF